jgi:hypothetical protein
VEEVEDAFLAGDTEALRRAACPICEGRLFYTVAKGEVLTHATPGRRVRCGISIYCRGRCGIMLSHLDGYCPEWAESVDDWGEFSAALYS